MSNNGTIIIMIIKQFECDAIASSRVFSTSPSFFRYAALADHADTACANALYYPQWNCLNGHNHNRKRVYAVPMLVCYYYSCRFLFGRLGSTI